MERNDGHTTNVMRGRFLFCKVFNTEIDSSSSSQLSASPQNIAPPRFAVIPASLLPKRQRSSPSPPDDHNAQFRHLYQQLRGVIPSGLSAIHPGNSTPRREEIAKKIGDESDAVDLIENAITYIRLLRSLLDVPNKPDDSTTRGGNPFVTQKSLPVESNLSSKQNTFHSNFTMES